MADPQNLSHADRACPGNLVIVGEEPKVRKCRGILSWNNAGFWECTEGCGDWNDDDVASIEDDARRFGYAE